MKGTKSMKKNRNLRISSREQKTTIKISEKLTEMAKALGPEAAEEAEAVAAAEAGVSRAEGLPGPTISNNHTKINPAFSPQITNYFNYLL